MSALTREHGVPFVLDATRISENALFVKEREPGYADRPLADVIREIADARRRRGLLLEEGPLRPDRRDAVPRTTTCWRSARASCVVVYEGFPHYGGMAGHDMEALAQGIRESADERDRRGLRRRRRGTSGALLEDAGVPIVEPGRRPRGLPRRQALPPPRAAGRSSRPRRSRRRSTSPAASARWSVESSRASTATEPYDGLELVRLTIPRRVYTQEHLDVGRRGRRGRARARDEVPGLRMTYEPEHLRFFQARFAPLEVFPDLAIENAEAAPALIDP